MENPFRDSGPFDKAMPYLSLIVSAALLITGLSMYRQGASPWWAIAAGVMVLLACHGIYRQVRPRGNRA
ncbi:hypothetical protein [Streptomyces sp. SID13588]|uniref:hypothetical protein n=1 Tax=Streptomyces sp. SID13588 TaxID=2706051 RepID=UPI0013CD3CCD|nr:hypothetical protein [Streptomyces sp. SID13588]NEA73818.1 hypothetical protein [Streptomyces sp. SID13588]